MEDPRRMEGCQDDSHEERALTETPDSEHRGQGHTDACGTGGTHPAATVQRATAGVAHEGPTVEREHHIATALFIWNE
ncbi:MAG: hypothetical protein ABFC80_08565 [Coriobacteriales bacterium]|nr:hypothetical protein [Actinomycetes bacterium]